MSYISISIIKLGRRWRKEWERGQFLRAGMENAYEEEKR
jgi:hypothetical protein